MISATSADINAIPTPAATSVRIMNGSVISWTTRGRNLALSRPTESADASRAPRARTARHLRGTSIPQWSIAVVEWRGDDVLVGGGASGVAGGDVAEGHGGTEVDAAGWVVPAHHVGLVAPRDVEPGDRVAVGGEDPGVRVGL